MSRPAQPVDSPQQSYLDAHRSGNIVWIDMIYVAPAQRGHGEGRRLFDQFVAGLPADIELLRVFAADTDGRGNSDEFWLRLGFRHRYSGGADDLSYEAAHTLVKGVNGHPTPAPIEA